MNKGRLEGKVPLLNAKEKGGPKPSCYVRQ